MKIISLETMAKTIIEEAIDYLAQKLKVEFPRRPQVVFEHPRDPNLTDAGNAWIYQTIPGDYDESTNTIYINCNLVKPEKFRRLISHELGHAHNAHFIHRRAGITLTDYRRKADRILSHAFVDEGIAEYFSFEFLQNHDDRDIQHIWPSNPADLLGKQHELGYHLVKPIITKLQKKGIELMVLHPPTQKELENPSLYQEKILEHIKITEFL